MHFEQPNIQEVCERLHFTFKKDTGFEHPFPIDVNDYFARSMEK